MATTQANRLLMVNTPLGKDALLINQFTGTERLSRLFNYHLHLSADLDKAAAVSADALIGQKVSVRLELHDEGERFYQGLISQFIEGEKDERFQYYYAEVVPWLWLLTLTSNCRIFQDQTVPEIIEQVFQDRGLTDYSFELKGNFTKWDYCVQYRETDFNFVSRLMEHEGIFYFFRHTEEKHTLVMANAPDVHQPCPGQPKAFYQPQAGMGERADNVTSWQMEQTLRPGRFAMRDYHFEMPGKSLEVVEPSLYRIGGNNNLEVYDYPGEYVQQYNKPTERLAEVETEARKLIKLRMGEEETPYQIIRGTSHCRAFNVGYRFELEGHSSAKNPYVLTSIQHSVMQSPSYISEMIIESPYQNTFTCIPLAIPFRPARVSLRPLVQGPQTAVVVGPPGEEIYTDKFGRIKVQFHWDREGKKDANSSCWVRVSQPWAGKRWGASFWPRIGQEVVVDFLEGDPDQPIVVGSVYNADQMPPYLGDGPDSKHKNDNKLTGVKSNSTKGGVGFNEWRFDDTKDKEQIFIHAERNMDTRVKNESMERVISHRHLIVGTEKDGKKSGDQREMVYQDKHLKVHRHQIEHIGGNMELLVGKGDGDGGNQDISIAAKKTETIGGDNDYHLKGTRKEKIDGSTSLTVGGSQQEKVGTKHAVEAGQEIHLKAGMKVIIEAGVQLTLKGPGGFVDIGPSGVTIQGIMVLINSGGSAGSGSGSSPESPKDAKEAKPAEPTVADDAKSGQKSAP